MKKLALFLVPIIILSILVGCSSIGSSESDSAGSSGSNSDSSIESSSSSSESNLDSSSNQFGSSAEEVACEFVVAVVTNDSEKFSACVHPSMLEDLAGSFGVELADSNDQVTTVDNDVKTTVRTYSSVTGEDLDSFKDNLSRDYSISVSKYMIYAIDAEFYDDYKNEAANYQWSIDVFYAEGRWYTLGWS